MGKEKIEGNKKEPDNETGVVTEMLTPMLCI